MMVGDLVDVGMGVGGIVDVGGIGVKMGGVVGMGVGAMVDVGIRVGSDVGIMVGAIVDEGAGVDVGGDPQDERTMNTIKTRQNLNRRAIFSPPCLNGLG